jgi:hypothetical protein
MEDTLVSRHGGISADVVRPEPPGLLLPNTARDVSDLQDGTTTKHPKSSYKQVAQYTSETPCENRNLNAGTPDPPTVQSPGSETQVSAAQTEDPMTVSSHPSPGKN